MTDDASNTSSPKTPPAATTRLCASSLVPKERDGCDRVGFVHLKMVVLCRAQLQKKYSVVQARAISRQLQGGSSRGRETTRSNKQRKPRPYQREQKTRHNGRPLLTPEQHAPPRVKYEMARTSLGTCLQLSVFLLNLSRRRPCDHQPSYERTLVCVSPHDGLRYRRPPWNLSVFPHPSEE